MKTISNLLIAALFVFAACSDDDMAGTSGNPNNPDDPMDDNGWLIPFAEVRDGGPGKDGIPALNSPKFTNVSDATYLKDNDLVLGFADGSEVRAYPHTILDWHEIINDDTENHSLAVIYCPLTGTGIGWDRMINDKKTTFGVSGLLYNSNIIPYDRLTNSNWSQLLLKSVNGEKKGTKAKTLNLVETSWKTWKEMYPFSKVISTNTGFNRSYGKYPYGDYKTSKNLIFPVKNKDNRLHEKERVLGIIIDGKAKAYRLSNFSGNGKLILNEYAGTSLVIAGSENANLIVAFNSRLADGTKLEFQFIENKLPALLRDKQGNVWDVFGRAIEGPRKGQTLQPVQQMMGYWFAFAAFYPEIEV